MRHASPGKPKGLLVNIHRAIYVVMDVIVDVRLAVKYGWPLT